MSKKQIGAVSWLISDFILVQIERNARGSLAAAGYD
jgi:hypothetical protein